MNAIFLDRFRQILAVDNRVFYIIAFASFCGAFALRIARDTFLITSVLPNSFELFSQKLTSGPDLLPFYFILNAVILTVFAGWLDGWLAKGDAKKVAKLSFIVSALAIALAIFTLWADEGNAWKALLFYALSEIPVFLFMNMIWIVADPYFSEEKQKSVFPKITTWAYLGIVILTGPLVVMTFLGGWNVSPFWLLFIAMLAGILVAICMGFLPPEDVSFEDDVIDINYQVPQMPSPSNGGILTSLLETAKWAWELKYLRYFTFATVCNFALLGVFDQTMATRAAETNYTPEGILNYLLLATFFFASISTIFQKFAFETILLKFGVGSVNLAAPVLMLLAALVLVFSDSDLLSTNNEAGRILIFAIVAARVFGWFAEFLFNQAMLPYIYGALRPQDVDRGRLFVEGPVTAITNGFVGVGLFIYLTIFGTAGHEIEVFAADGTSQITTTAKLDFLIIIATVLAIIMLFLSLVMRPEYKKSMLRRLDAGGNPIWMDSVMKRAMPVIEAIGLSMLDPKGRLLIRQLRVIFAEGDHLGLIEKFPKDAPPPSPEVIESVTNLAEELGQLSMLQKHLQGWINDTDDDNKLFVSLAQALGKFGFDGNQIVGNLVSERSKGKSKYPFQAHDKMEISMVMGSDQVLREACDLGWEEGGMIENTDWSKVADLPLSDSAVALDLFLLQLVNLTDRRSPFFPAAKSVLGKTPWLRAVVLRLVMNNREDTPDTFKNRRYVIVLLLKGLTSPEMAQTDKSALQTAYHVWRDRYSNDGSTNPVSDMQAQPVFDAHVQHDADALINQTLMATERNGNISESLCAALLDQLIIGQEPALIGSLAEVIFALDNNALEGLAPETELISAWKKAIKVTNELPLPLDKNALAIWRHARAIQWVSARLWLCFLSERIAYGRLSKHPDELAVLLVEAGRKGDRVLTILEQSIKSRDTYQALKKDIQEVIDLMKDSESGIGYDPILAEYALA